MSDRLDKLLNMLASPNDGEIANAGRMIAAVAHKANKTVSGLVRTGGGGERIIYRDNPADAYLNLEIARLRRENATMKEQIRKTMERQQRERAGPRETFGDDDLRSYARRSESYAGQYTKSQREEESDAALRKDLLWALHFHRREGDVLTAWEVEFCEDMTHTFPAAMSYRQRDLAKQIIKKARRSDREPLI